MKKGVRILAWTAGILAGLLVVLIVGLQIFLNSNKFKQIINDSTADAITGELRYSDLHFSLIKAFPKIAVELDSLSITYPHELFSEYDRLGLRSRLLSSGRGEQEDTLVAVSNISAAVNIWRLFGGTIRLSHLTVAEPKVYMHKYTADASNLDIFKSSDEPDTTASEPFGLPWISLGKVSLSGDPRIVYTSQADTVYANIAFDEIFLKGKVRIKKDKLASKLKKLDFGVDSLVLEGRLPADTLLLALNSLSLKTPKTNLLDLGLDADLSYMSPALGELDVPLELASRLGFEKKKDNFRLDLHSLDANLAHIPLTASGLAELYDNRTYLDAKAAIQNCDLATVLKAYAHNFTAAADDVWTDARLNLALGAKGNLSDEEYPAVEASLQVPEGSVKYFPKDILAKLSMDLGGNMTPEGVLSADVNEIKVSSDFLNLMAAGGGNDLLGNNADVHANLDASAVLEKLVRLLPDGIFAASGNVDLACRLNARLAELKDYNFERTRVNCALSADKVDVRMIQNGMKAFLNRPDIKLGNSSKGLELRTLADSIAFDTGNDLNANIRNFGLNADVSKVMVDGKYAPHVLLTNIDDKIFVRSGDNKILLSNASIGLQADKRSIKNSKRSRMRHRMDSLRRLYPGVSRDSLFALAGFKRRKIDDFASKDFKFELDSSLIGLYDKWKPGGMVAVEDVHVISPSLPLRTRINTLNLSLDDDDAKLVSFDADCGSSDINMNGDLGGFRRFLHNRGPLKFNFNLNSDRINLNEIMLAMQKAKDTTLVVSNSETDESFVVDTLAESEYAGGMEMKAIIVPRNLSGSINLNAKQIDYTSVKVSPVVGQLNIDKRILQLKELKADTNVGSIDLDAFYATKSKDDISLGLDLHLNNMPAYDIIHMLPSVDQMMPAIRSFQGNLDFVASATTQLDTNMSPIMSSLNGLVRIGGEDLYVKNAGSLRKITRLLMFKNKNIGEIRNLYVDAMIGDEKVNIYPFVLGVERYTLALDGVQRFNGKLKYNVSVLESIIPFRFGIKLRGSLDNWRFRLGRSSYKGLKRVPTYGPQLDTMEMNILYSIRNVFDDGVDKAMSSVVMDKLFKERMARDSGLSVDESDALMSKEEFLQLDSAILEVQMQSDSLLVHEEVDSILDQAFEDVEFLQAEWEATHPWAARAVKREEQKAIEQRKAREKAEAEEKNKATAKKAE